MCGVCLQGISKILQEDNLKQELTMAYRNRLQSELSDKWVFAIFPTELVYNFIVCDRQNCLKSDDAHTY